MRIVTSLVLRGPNLWAAVPLLEVEVAEAVRLAPDAAGRVLGWLPGLAEHRCAPGPGGRFAERLRAGLAVGPVVEHAALELLRLAGRPIAPARGCREAEPNRVLVPFEEEELGRSCFDAAWGLVQAAVAGKPFDTPAAVAALHELAERVCFGPNSGAILRAAKDRGIPTRRLGTGSLLLLGQGVHQRRVRSAETDQTSAVAKYISSDKALTKSLLRAIGVPVPEGRPVASADDAWEAARTLGMPVVVKPLDSFHGRGVALGLTRREAIESAFHLAAREGTGVLVERFAPGAEHRLLIVAGRLVAAARGEPAYVTGDGTSSIAALIESQLNSDPRRGADRSFPLNRVVIGPVVELELAQAGFDADSVPAAGERVLVQRRGNHACDVTDQVHPDVAARAVEAAAAVGLDIAGIDIVAEDIGRPLEEQGGVIVEVNEGPGLDIHLMPGAGMPRPVGEAIVASLFPNGTDGRVPLVAVTGGADRTETAAAIARLLTESGHTVGLACRTGLFVGPRRVRSGDEAHYDGVRNLLLHPHVELAVVEVAPEPARNEGLGFERCDVAVLTGPADPGPEPVDTIAAAARLVRSVLTPTGWTIRAAGTRHAGGDPAQTLLYATDETDPDLIAHRQSGGCGVCPCAEGIRLFTPWPGSTPAWRPSPALPHCSSPATLAAFATVWCLGQDSGRSGANRP